MSAPPASSAPAIAKAAAPSVQVPLGEKSKPQVPNIEAVGASAPKPEVPKAEAASQFATARPEVKTAVEVITQAKPAAESKPTSAMDAVVTEKVKAEKPKASSEAALKPVTVVPAQVPSPSMVGVSGPPATVTATQVAFQAAEATYRSTPAATSLQAPAPAPRTSAQQASGQAPGAASAGTAVAASAARVGGTLPVAAPRRAVEIVSRAPTPATVSLPPEAGALPADVPAVGFAHALGAMAQGVAQSLGFSAPPAASPGVSGTAAPAVVPREGPAAVAVGRSVVRGANPSVQKTAAAKLTTSIAKKYQIVCVSSEVAPWSKTGGLGEAMDGLPIALAALGHRVMTISPRYDQYAEAWDTGYWSHVPMGSSTEAVHAFHCFQSKVDRVFVDHDCFLSKVPTKTGSMLYGPEWGKDFADNQWRFVYFAKAVLKIIQELPLAGFPYGSKTIVVVNDWHSAMVPVFLAMERKAIPGKWAETKTALLIHNAVFQGRFDRDDPEEPSDDVYGFPEAILSTFTFKMPLKVGRTEPSVKRCMNWLAAAAKYADRNLTVSPTYAWELINLPEMGVELEEIFAQTGMTGIVNGVKEGVSPMDAAFTKKAKMPSTFSAKDVDDKKAELKAMLQEMYGLPVSPAMALCVFVGRMDLQKGYDYLLAALQAVLEKLDLQVIIIGTGRADLVSSSKTLAKKFPEKVHLAGWCGPERYAMVAGADYNLMPSRWEPCGLAQMESMRFGTLPVVAQTGGLVDTVEDGVTGIHLGGAVSVEKELDPASVELVAQALERCVEVYAQKELTSQMRKSAMAAGREYTWSNAALQYEAVFEELGAVNVLPLCKDASVTLEVDRVVA